MKIDFSFRISLGVSLFLALFCTLCLIGFIVKYRQNSIEMRHFSDKFQELQLQKRTYEKHGNYTLKYYRIEKTLDKISGEKISKKTRTVLTEKLWQISMTYDIDPLLILAIVLQESGGNPNVKGKYKSGAESGAYGLMQIKIETAKSLGKKFGVNIESAEDLMQPDINLVLGTAFLLRLIGHYEDVKHAVIAYNIGQGKVDRLLAEKKKLPMKYYEGVLSKYRALMRQLDSELSLIVNKEL